MSDSKKPDTARQVELGALSFLNPAAPEPWASFIEQIDRVAPHMGSLSKWVAP